MPSHVTRRRRRKRHPARRPHLLTKITAFGLFLLVVYVSVRTALPAHKLGSPDPALPLWQAHWLRVRLARNIDLLTVERGRNSLTEDFYVESGEPASAVSIRLAERKIVPDARTLRDYLVYKGLDAKVEAGYFQFTPAMSTLEVANTLTNAMPSEVHFHMWAGWRFEQVANALSRHPHLDVDGDTFQVLASRQLPLPGDYSLLDSLPPNATLEGYLYPGDYILSPRSTAPEALSKMLTVFDGHIDHINSLAKQQNLSLHQLVTLASIVQRETIQDTEAPLIAGVFLNRLALGMPLSADPTTQYALGIPSVWWPPLTIDPRLVQHPYNTYVTIGLPPGPIASPGAAALNGVGNPQKTEFLYFRAACDKTGRHKFSRTYREHLLWACDT